MKKLKKLLSVLLLIVMLFTFIPQTTYAEAETDNLNFIGAEYIRRKSDYVIHLVIYTANLIDEVFTGKFFVTGKQTYTEDITGSFTNGGTWNSSSNYTHCFIFNVNWKNGGYYCLDLDDEKGILNGYANNEGVAGLNCTFTGKPKTLALAEKVSTIEISDELYDECLDLSVATYGKIDSPKEENKSGNMESSIPDELQETLEKYDHQNIIGYNYHDNNDDNVSFAIANKKLTDGTYQCTVAIRGTDGVEWEGNMKICPPDENGNYDVYTFGESDDKTHYNFLTAANYVENALTEYLEDNKLNSEKTTVVLTGHSRGGAVSNLLAKNLTTQDFIPKVTAYTFATPNVSPYSETMENYNNIYNFCKNKDFIPCIPLTNNDWCYWKYGTTYIEDSSDNKVYCNKITDIMADEDYAPNVKEYYIRKFELKNNTKIKFSLYDFMILSLASPMQGDNYINNFKISTSILKWLGDDIKGLFELSNVLRNNLKWILVNHWQKGYSLLKYSDYRIYTYEDALSRCNVGGLDSSAQSLMSYATSNIELNSTETGYNLIEVGKIKQFLQYTDKDGITNADKLGWNVDNYTTWSDISFNENGNITTINLSFKDLYGALNLSDFIALTSVDVSSNYLTYVNVNNCTALTRLDVSDNELTALDVSSATSLSILNFGCNEISEINLANNSLLTTLECSSCLLETLDISNLTNLNTLNCSFNKLSTIDITNNSNLTEFYCMLNYIDLYNTELVSTFKSVEEKADSEIVYEPQYLPKNAQLNPDEINALKAFAITADNNDILNWIDDSSNLIIENVQCFVEFKKVDNEYRVSAVDFSSEDVTGEFNANSFIYLKELYCDESSLTSINSKDCLLLEILNCDNCQLNSLVLPSNVADSTSALYNLSCVYNYLDINMFTPEIITNIESKENGFVNYKKQIINAPITEFNSNDYNLLVDFYNQQNNKSVLSWDLNKPGDWGEIVWKYDNKTKKYYLNDCKFDCMDIDGNIDLSSCTKLETVSFSGSDIRTVSLPDIDVEDGAFYDCTKLEAVVLNGGTSIGDGAFKFCESLQAVYIPNSITTIGQNAFENSPSVTVAGNAGSYAETYCNENNKPFKAGYFICGNTVTKESPTESCKNYYPIEDVQIIDISKNTVANTDKYGYFVVFELANGEYNYDLSYNYGFDDNFSIAITDNCTIITAPIEMVSFDFHKDGYINAKDYAVFIRHINGKENTIEAKFLDINKNGTVDTNDWQFAQNFI